MRPRWPCGHPTLEMRTLAKVLVLISKIPCNSMRRRAGTEASFLLVVPACGAEGFKALDFCFDVVGFQVQVHALFRDLLVVGLLQEDSYFGVGKPKFSVDRGACFVHRLIDSAESCSPEGGSFVKVKDVDDEVTYATAVRGQAPFESMRSWTTLWASSSLRAMPPHPVMTSPS